MKPIPALLMALAITLGAAALAAEPSPEEKQARCRKACDEAVAHLRRTPAQPGRDQERKDALEKKIVTLIEENRRKGVDHCVTWGQVMGIAFTQ